MIVLHGVLGGMKNFRGICNHEDIKTRRDSYLLEARNHVDSDHHDDMNYEVLSDDVMRFADKHKMETFTLLGHSMGGRTSMTLACKY